MAGVAPYLAGVVRQRAVETSHIIDPARRMPPPAGHHAAQRNVRGDVETTSSYTSSHEPDHNNLVGRGGRSGSLGGGGGRLHGPDQRQPGVLVEH